MFAGFDLDRGYGRIFGYDVTGGRHEETQFFTVGSGSLFARGAMKKLYRDDLSEIECVTLALQALYDAADDDSATGGPDLTRRIFPVIHVGDRRRRPPAPDEDEIAVIADRVVGARMNRPDGPVASLDLPGRGGEPMSMPFYVSPEQLMKDRADFARKGIARGRSLVAVQYADGVLFVTENPSQALHKVSEIYDRIAFAAVGRYNEFENLRIAGVRLADMRGYSYDRRDVTGRGLANAYAQTLGTIFSSGGEKPYEVEIFVAEVGEDRRGRPDLPAHLRGPGRRRARLRRDGRRRGDRVVVPRRALRRGLVARRRARSRGRGAGPLDRRRPDDRPGDPGRATSRSPSSTAPASGRASSRGSGPPGSRSCSVTAVRPSTPRPSRARTRRRRFLLGTRRRPTDDPADPTDQVSGDVPPLEDPGSGEPPVAPPL